MGFQLDKRLEGDTLPIASLESCELLLMNDARWPWLILVPRIDGAVEWHELFTDQRQDVDFEIANTAAALKGLTGCEKVNIGSLGNMVRQLHIHIIARSQDDPNWPGPVWGYGERTAYDGDVAEQLIQNIRRMMDLEYS